MNERELESFSSFIEEEKEEPKVKKEPMGGQKEEKVTMAASDLRAIKARLLQLEELERSRKEDERAKKDASRVFGLWNKELSQGLGLSLSDLKQSGAQPRMNQGRWQPQQPPPMLGVPAPKQMKLCLTKFSGKEQYKGLGSGFKEWGKRFLRQLNLAQRASGFMWHEDLMVDVLSQHLEGKALSYFNAQYESWFQQEPTLLYVMDCMYRAFSVQLTLKQASVLFEQPKDPHRTFHQHYAYLVEVDAAAGGGLRQLGLRQHRSIQLA